MDTLTFVAQDGAIYAVRNGQPVLMAYGPREKLFSDFSECTASGEALCAGPSGDLGAKFTATQFQARARELLDVTAQDLAASWS